MLIGNVFDIQRFSTHDGPGIRTTVFLKGCPLRCLWCHNPEGIDYNKVIGYYKDSCIGCGECIKLCENKALSMQNGNINVDRNKCIGCGKCLSSCDAGALRIYGKEMTAQQVVAEILKDKSFYENGGGVTVSGGEPLSQPDFTYELLHLCKQKGINTAVETCGYAKWDNLNKLTEVCDLFLYDIKCITPKLHKDGTGADNKIILENLKRLSGSSKIIVRIPVIPQFNDNIKEMSKLSYFLKDINIAGVELLPFHSFASQKYSSLNLDYKYNNIKMTTNIETLRNLF